MTYAFDALLQEFATAKGFDSSGSARGLEFDFEGTQVWIVQHPLHENHLLAEVGVTTWVELPPASVLALLLQINEAARFEHAWSIVMDGSFAIHLSTSVALEGLTLAQLEALMLDGLERGQLLQGLLSEALSPIGDADTISTAGSGLDSMSMMRV